VETSQEGSPHTELAALLARCCEELLASLSSPTTVPADVPVVSKSVVSFVELTGADVGATLVARFEEGFLGRTHPRRHRRLMEEDLAGWASEIVNQVGGRFVNKLGQRGVNARIGIPGSLLGPTLHLHLPVGATKAFARGGLSLFLALDELRRPLMSVAQDDATRQEGELVLF